MPTKFLKFSPTFTINYQLMGKKEKSKKLKKSPTLSSKQKKTISQLNNIKNHLSTKRNKMKYKEKKNC